MRYSACDGSACMIKQLIEESKKNLDYFFSEVDVSKLEAIVELCIACKGLIICTGVGKSGIIAEKIAATLASTGTRSLYLPTLNFLHGDIGMVSEGDIVFMFSKSGEAEELLNLLPFIRKKRAKVIALTSRENSHLAKGCDLHMLLPMQKELCSFNLVPTTSTELQLIFGNILTIALMQLRKFTLNDYALNHPLGAIGKTMTLSAKDLMLSGSDLPLCFGHNKLEEVLLELTQKKCGTLLVTNKQSELEGVFTDGDLRRALERYGSNVLKQEMRHLMTEKAITIESHLLASEALKEMQKNVNKWVMIAPVLEGNKLVGLLRMHDIIQAGIH
jgi:arabinose-5-phosphate isomerase